MPSNLKKAVCFLLVTIISFSCLLLCGCQKQSSDKPVIVTTLFPQFDFVRQLCGDEVESVCLLSPGVESHSYDPSPKDIQTVADCGLFVYTGDEMEPWAGSVIASCPETPVLCLTDGINVITGDHDEDEDEHEHEEHEHSYDPHIWLDLQNAQKMVNAIADKITELFPSLSATVSKNRETYCATLSDLDSRFKTAVSASPDKTVVFGGRFAYAYFVKRYGLKYKTVYSGCSAEVEPSAKHVEEIINFIKQNNVRYILHEELSDPKVARSISEATDAQLLEFSTAHNVAKDQFDNGITFTVIMEENLFNLKKALDQV